MRTQGAGYSDATRATQSNLHQPEPTPWCKKDQLACGTFRQEAPAHAIEKLPTPRIAYSTNKSSMLANSASRKALERNNTLP
jgi:hypothetical protein